MVEDYDAFLPRRRPKPAPDLLQMEAEGRRWAQENHRSYGRYVETLAYEDTSDNRTEFRFDRWKTEKARPAGDYRITGPKGTRVVEN